MNGFKRFLNNANGRLKIGIVIIFIFLIFGGIVPLFCPSDPMLMNTYPPDLGISSEHFLGTTKIGQDIFWQLALSTRNSLIIGVIVATIGTVVGVLVGLTAGFKGGLFDRVMMVLTDSFIVIPSLPILILMTSLLKGRTSVFILALVLSCFSWAWPSRQIRAMALSLKEREFINVAWFSGETSLEVVVTEILPYVVSWALSNFVNAVLVAIAAESGLAILGLSAANLPTLGNMIQWARQYNAILLQRWLWIGSPVVTTMALFIGLFLTMTGYNDYKAMERGR